ncbi:hypothetical protein PAXRUDRAFT_154283 [Paxillus rubicundulus Ve08.2h10]|uniref:Uncharacterized protein n=1 Tax=Paxillus rubicundulus Ve08.2h10 TaxID=930991 RepID=A0A0D0DKH0_9AGAM|nr:hypothetical protein PAXRUDRAFT_154283 [Paxillus rubicundulus Ve08.2h10]
MPEVKDASSTSAQLITHTSSENLTLNDWLMVVAYIDACPSIPQANVVNHFKTLKSGALIFTQSTLFCKLKDCLKSEECVNDNPSALSLK